MEVVFNERTAFNPTSDEKSVQEIIDILGRLGTDKRLRESVLEKLENEHRTNQQNVMRFIVELIHSYAKRDRSDARNNASIRFAKQITSLIEEGEINDGIPYI